VSVAAIGAIHSGKEVIELRWLGARRSGSIPGVIVRLALVACPRQAAVLVSSRWGAESRPSFERFGDAAAARQESGMRTKSRAGS